MDRDTLPAVPEVAPLALPDVRDIAEAMTLNVTNSRGGGAAIGLAAPLIGAVYIEWAAERLRDLSQGYRREAATHEQARKARCLALAVGVERATADLRSLARQLREGQ